MALGAIIGNAGATSILRRAAAEGRVAPAYLLHGPERVGKQAAALEFAKVLNCLQPVEVAEGEVDCCDECENCRAIEAGRFADVRLVRPLIRLGTPPNVEYTEFEGAVLTTEQIAEVIAAAGFKPSKGRRKVFVIARAETMNAEAANRLLKTLEEPPAGTTIILTSSNPSALLPTIISRCQGVAMKLVGREELEEALRQRYPQADDELLATAAALAAGRPGWAITLLGHPEALAVREALLELVEQVATSRPVFVLAAGERLVQLAERWWRATRDGEAADEVLRRSRDRALRIALAELAEMLAAFFRDCMVAASGGGQVVNRDRLALVERMAELLGANQARALADRAVRMHREILGNANIRLACEIMMLDTMAAGTRGRRARS